MTLLSPSITNSSLSSNNTYYRSLIRNAAERKRTVSACRDLRSLITFYEQSFKKFHGRPPKGIAERSPLADTYTRYKILKKVIRDYAACRIQAFVRGVVARQRNNDVHADNSKLISGESKSSSKFQPLIPCCILNLPKSLARKSKRKNNFNKGEKENEPTRHYLTEKQRNSLLKCREKNAGQLVPNLSCQRYNLGSLKMEIEKTHKMLGVYERFFYREHGRQVSSFADIKPVAEDYGRYKRIKRMIKNLQCGNRKM